MQDHAKVLVHLQLVAKTALNLAGKFNDKEYAGITLEAYSEKRANNAVRSDVQQQVCDMKIAVDEAVALLEKLGFADVLARYNA